MNKYVYIVKEGDSYYGRLSENFNTTGFIVFLHRRVREKKEGLFKVSNILIKESKNGKYGFVDGEYINFDDFKINDLSIKELADITGVGYINSLYKIKGKNVVCVKYPYNLNNVYLLGFYIKGSFKFICKAPYLSQYIKYNRDIIFIEKELHCKGLGSSFRGASQLVDKVSDNNITPYINEIDEEHVIFRRILTDNNNMSHYILLYRTDSDIRFNNEIYNYIMDINDKVSKYIRDNIDILVPDSDKGDYIKQKILKLLTFYNL